MYIHLIRAYPWNSIKREKKIKHHWIMKNDVTGWFTCDLDTWRLHMYSAQGPA
jgi:hypothetical protein